MRKLSETPAIAVAAAAQKVVHVAVELGAAAGLNAAAANDYIVYEGVDGKWHVDTIASTSGSAPDISLTLTNNIVTGGIALGGRILYLGLAADGHETAAIAASSDTTFEGDPAYFVATKGEPMVLYDNNATVAGSILGGIEINFDV
jgi:hypothetical protein